MVVSIYFRPKQDVELLTFWGGMKGFIRRSLTFKEEGTSSITKYIDIRIIQLIKDN